MNERSSNSSSSSSRGGSLLNMPALAFARESANGGGDEWEGHHFKGGGGGGGGQRHELEQGVRFVLVLPRSSTSTEGRRRLLAAAAEANSLPIREDFMGRKGDRTCRTRTADGMTASPAGRQSSIRTSLQQKVRCFPSLLRVRKLNEQFLREIAASSNSRALDNW